MKGAGKMGQIKGLGFIITILTLMPKDSQILEVAEAGGGTWGDTSTPATSPPHGNFESNKTCVSETNFSLSFF